MKKLIVLVFAVLVSVSAIAQEPAPAAVPELTSDERTAFDTVKAFDALAQAKALETKEGKAFQKAVAEYQEKLKTFQATVQATPRRATGASAATEIGCSCEGARRRRDQLEYRRARPGGISSGEALIKFDAPVGGNQELVAGGAGCQLPRVVGWCSGSVAGASISLSCFQPSRVTSQPARLRRAGRGPLRNE